MSSIFRLDSRDLIKGLVVTMLSAAFTTAGVIVKNKQFMLTADDGWYILACTLSAAFSYLTKQLLTDENGKLAGRL